MNEIATSFKRVFLEFFNTRVIDKVPEFIIALIIFVIGVKVARSIRSLMKNILNKYTKTQSSLINFAVYAIHILILVFVTLVCLSIVGFKTTSIAAIIGAAGLSVGLALKEIFSDIGAALVILFFKPFNIGDFIIVPGEGIEGTVTDVQLCFTYVKTNDNKIIVCPNSMLVNNDVINATHQNYRRIDLIFRVDIDTSYELMKEICDRIIDEDDRIEKNPRPIIGIEDIGNGIMVFVCKPWVRTELYWDVYYDVMRKFKFEFDDNSVKFPMYTLNGNSK